MGKAPSAYFTREVPEVQTLRWELTALGGASIIGVSIPIMRRVNWTITERQHRELKRLSRETGLPISELVRRALDKYIGLLGEGPQSEELKTENPRTSQKSEVRS